MPRNDPMQDGIWTDTPGIGTDFEDMMFEDIEADDLLWLQATGGDTNHVTCIHGAAGIQTATVKFSGNGSGGANMTTTE